MDVSDIFYFFMLGGGGKGESEAPGGGVAISFSKSQEGEVSRPGCVGTGGRRAGTVSAGNLGGGGQIFFSAGCPKDTRPSRGFSESLCDFFLCAFFAP